MRHAVQRLVYVVYVVESMLCVYAMCMLSRLVCTRYEHMFGVCVHEYMFCFSVNRRLKPCTLQSTALRDYALRMHFVHFMLPGGVRMHFARYMQITKMYINAH